MLLGGIWVQMGDLARAEKLIEPSIADLEKRLGPNHATTAGAKGVLALIRHVQGRDAESKAIYQEALAGRRIALGSRHAKVGILLGQYANTLKSLGEFALAKQTFEESLSILAETFGPESGESSKAWSNYGLLLFRMDDWQGAEAATDPAAEESYLRRALAVRRAVHDPTHPDLARAVARLGHFLCTGKVTETSATEGRDLLDQALALAAYAGESSRPDPEEVTEWTATRAKCGR